MKIEDKNKSPNKVLNENQLSKTKREMIKMQDLFRNDLEFIINVQV